MTPLTQSVSQVASAPITLNSSHLVARSDGSCQFVERLTRVVMNVWEEGKEPDYVRRYFSA